MRIVLTAWLAICFSVGLTAQQTQKQENRLPQVTIQHNGTSATVFSNAYESLQEAITTVRKEYGWVVHYEDPPYQSTYDVIVGTSAEDLAAHPLAVPLKRPAGGNFQSTYPEHTNIRSSSAEEEQTLNQIVFDYNRSGNPGGFVVSK